MKASKVLFIGIWLLTIQATIASAQVFHVRTFKASVKGTSSLHDWESSVEKLEAKGFFVVENATISSLRDVVVTIPVKSIKSTKGNMMDTKTWEAFNFEKYPSITFVMGENTINDVTKTMSIHGTLTMAGTSRPTGLVLTYKVLPGGELQVKGTVKLLMSAWQMEPPTAMMGAIKVGDEVEVRVDLVLTTKNNL